MFCLAVNADTRLAALVPADAETLFSLINASRAHLRTWVPWVDDTLTVADALRFIARAQRQADTNQALYAGLWHQQTLIGVLALNYIDTHRGQTEFGYWLGAPYQGQGHMTAACRALVEYVFTELKLCRVEIHCSPGNHRSRAIPQRLQFVEEHTARQFEWLRGSYSQMVVYVMTAARWQQLNGARPAGLP